MSMTARQSEKEMSHADTNAQSVAPTGHQPSSAVSTRPRCFAGENSPTSA